MKPGVSAVNFTPTSVAEVPPSSETVGTEEVLQIEYCGLTLTGNTARVAIFVAPL